MKIEWIKSTISLRVWVWVGGSGSGCMSKMFSHPPPHPQDRHPQDSHPQDYFQRSSGIITTIFFLTYFRCYVWYTSDSRHVISIRTFRHRSSLNSIWRTEYHWINNRAVHLNRRSYTLIWCFVKSREWITRYHTSLTQAAKCDACVDFWVSSFETFQSDQSF
jgi:hypothetical protein